MSVRDDYTYLLTTLIDTVLASPLFAIGTKNKELQKEVSMLADIMIMMLKKNEEAVIMEHHAALFMQGDDSDE